MGKFSFKQIHKDTKTRVRVGIIHTPHGDIHTPAFVPVGTQATVKSLIPDRYSTRRVYEIQKSIAQIISVIDFVLMF